MDLYKALKDAGCEIDGHESDLHVRLTDASAEIIRQAKARGTPFVSDGNIWLEIPFIFTPFWERRINRSKSV